MDITTLPVQILLVIIIIQHEVGVYRKRKLDNERKRMHAELDFKFNHMFSDVKDIKNYLREISDSHKESSNGN